MDGKCVVCGEYTDYFCDACSDFICEAHQIVKEAGSYGNVSILCPKCAKSGKKVKYPIKGEMHQEQGC